ncbi:unnamed protein product, partial [Linum tenue]
KLFVFGDSYADTGNSGKSASSWKEPYGITFPGKPAGRFSDGRIFTDYIASYLGIESPIPYTTAMATAQDSRSRHLQYGMNFAYGGTGVFDTFIPAPNMSVQINLLEKIIEERKVYTKQDLLNSSFALVSIAGNDYLTYANKKGNPQELPGLTERIIAQLSENLNLIHGLGVSKVAITTLPPIGCLPVVAAANSYRDCNETWNSAAKYHNQLLQQAVESLNNRTNKSNVFGILDTFSAFMAEFKKSNGSGSGDNPLKPCCIGVSSDHSCGDVDEKGGNGGAKKYVVCNNPSLSMFWDMLHPAQNGWQAVYQTLKPSLHEMMI